MKIKPYSVALAIASVAIATSSVSAQTSDQLRSCRDYVASQYDRVSASDVRVSQGEQRPNGRSTVNWQVRNSGASGFCVVNRRNEVVNFRQDSGDRYNQDRYNQDRYNQDRYNQDRYNQDRYNQDRYNRDRYNKNPNYDDNYSGSENDWGYRIRPYQAEISERGTTLVNRPDKTNKRDVANMDRGDRVTVYRSYQERDTGITWLYVRDSKGREGWVNSRRVSQD